MSKVEVSKIEVGETAPVIASGLRARGYSADAVSGVVVTNAEQALVQDIAGAYAARGKKRK